MARLTTVILALVACFFLIIPQIVIADTSVSKEAAAPAAAALTPPIIDTSQISAEPSQVQSTPAAQNSSPPPSPSPPPPPPPPSPSPSPSQIPLPTPTPISSLVIESSTPPPPPSSSQVSSTPPSSSVQQSTAMSSSTPPASSKTTIKYSYNKSNFIYNSTINGKVVTITSTSSAPPIPTHTAQGSNAKVNTTHVIIAISSIGGVAILSTVGFAWMKLYKGRRGGWDDDELMNSSSYGNSSHADPFKSTLDQYHRS